MTDAHNSGTAVAPAAETQPLPTRFELKADECAADGLRRIVLEQVDLATWHARRIGVADAHVHGVRRTTKRVRAALRLVRDDLDEESYRHDNEVLRDVARDLSAVRSATVRVETLEALVVWRGALAASATEIRGGLVNDAAQMRSAVSAKSPLIDDMVVRLERTRAGVEGWTLPPALVPTTLGLGRTYRRGRRGMAMAHSDASTERFHEWRKRVKYLRHQMEILAAGLPETMRRITVDVVELGDGLGFEHDLADLGSALSRPSAAIVSSTAARELLDAIARRRKELQDELRPLAERVYGQTPKDFVRDVAAHWEKWVG